LSFWTALKEGDFLQDSLVTSVVLEALPTSVYVHDDREGHSLRKNVGSTSYDHMLVGSAMLWHVTPRQQRRELNRGSAISANSLTLSDIGYRVYGVYSIYSIA